MSRQRADDGSRPRAGLLDRVQSVAVLVTCVTLLYLGVSERIRNGLPDAPLPKAVVPFDDAPTIGSADASVVLMIFSDYECPFCGRFARETWPQIKVKDVDTEKVLVVYRQAPLEIHRNARLAAAAALCANRLGQNFAEMDALLFQDQKRLDRPALLERASRIGLGVDLFNDCLDGPVQQVLTAESEAVAQLGMRSTPSFYIGRREGAGISVLERIKGAQPLSVFETVIDGVVNEGRWTRIRRRVGLVW